MNSTQEKLTKIESVIREVCPELQELTFGCEVVYNEDFPQVIISPENSTNHIASLYTKNNEICPIEDIGDFKIIGHPIHLNHILRAIYELGDTIYMSTTGEVIDAGTCVCNYDFAIPLQSQSDEFISWLYGVLVGE